MTVGLVAQFLHLLAASIWIGGVFFVAFAVVPAARDGRLEHKMARTFANRFDKVSIASAVVLFVTGGHMAGTRYTAESLTSTFEGYMVLSMLVLWLVLLGLVQIGKAKLTSSGGPEGFREAAKLATPWYRGAAVVSVLLLGTAALLNYPGGLQMVAGL